MEINKSQAKTNPQVVYLDPVGFSAYDQVFADMIKQYKLPQTDAFVVSLNPKSVPPKVTDLEFRVYEKFMELDTVKAARYCALQGVDAMVIGCFYDPGLLDCREISGNCVVVAPCQSSCEIALNLANNFSVIIGEYKWEDQMKSTIYEYGYRDKLASFEAVGLRVEDFHDDPKKTKELLIDAAIKAVQDSRAESIILGCTLEVGFFKDINTALQTKFGRYIPVIDASIAAFKSAEYFANLKFYTGLTNSRIWGMEPPPEDELVKFDILQTPYEFGNSIHIPPTK